MPNPKSFEKHKQDFLSKLDKSSKGNIDEPIIPLLEALNSLSNYYTTSSCSGRITLTNADKFAKTLFVSHSEVKEMPLSFDEKQVWFKFEDFIIHVCAKSLEDAKKLLSIARVCGLKRCGIISLEKKIIIEIIGSQRIEALIKDKDFTVSKEYAKQLVKFANKKLEKANKKIKELEKKITSSFS